MGMVQRVKNLFFRRDGYLFHASWKLLLRKPLLGLRLVKMYAAYAICKRPPLRLVDMAITAACMYNCPHCYPDSFYTDEKKPLTEKEIEALLCEARRIGVVQFNFQGGEPTIDIARLERITKMAGPLSHYISISTNGFTTDREKLERIFKAGVDKLAISLHSALSEEHDAFVGHEGAYDRAMLCAENARDIGLEVTFAITLSRDNFDSEGARGVIDKCIRENTILDINVAMPAGRWAGASEMLLTAEQYSKLDAINAKHPNIRRDLHPHLLRCGCLAGQEILYVNVHGAILSCPFLHFSPGNVREISLSECRETILSSPWFDKTPNVCLACEHVGFFEKNISQTVGQVDLPLPWSAVKSCTCCGNDRSRK